MNREVIKLMCEVLDDLKQVSMVVDELVDGQRPAQNIHMLSLHLLDLREKWVRRAARGCGSEVDEPSLTKH